MTMKSKFTAKLLITLCSLLLLTYASPLSAGWGRTDKTVEFDDIEWDQVFFKMNKLHYTAFVPGYDGSSLEDTTAFISGSYAGATYIITTDIEEQFVPPATEKKFLASFGELADEYKLIPIKAKSFGALYAVDLIPKNGADRFFRFVVANNSLIIMYTNDPNLDTRDYFFNSLKIYPK